MSELSRGELTSVPQQSEGHQQRKKGGLVLLREGTGSGRWTQSHQIPDDLLVREERVTGLETGAPIGSGV